MADSMPTRGRAQLVACSFARPILSFAAWRPHTISQRSSEPGCGRRSKPAAGRRAGPARRRPRCCSSSESLWPSFSCSSFFWWNRGGRFFSLVPLFSACRRSSRPAPLRGSVAAPGVPGRRFRRGGSSRPRRPRVLAGSPTHLRPRDLPPRPPFCVLSRPPPFARHALACWPKRPAPLALARVPFVRHGRCAAAI